MKRVILGLAGAVGCVTLAPHIGLRLMSAFAGPAPESTEHPLSAESDFIVPATEQFWSPDRSHQFWVVVDDYRKTRQSTGILLRALPNSSRWQTLWHEKLHHDLRPHHVFLSNSGAVITFDEWEPVESDSAIVVYKANQPVEACRYSVDDIIRKAGVQPYEVLEAPKEPGSGWWLQERPDQDGDLLRFRTANRKLLLDSASCTLKLLAQ